METRDNTNEAVTRIDLRWRGTCTHVPLWLRPWLQVCNVHNRAGILKWCVVCKLYIVLLSRQWWPGHCVRSIDLMMASQSSDLLSASDKIQRAATEETNRSFECTEMLFFRPRNARHLVVLTLYTGLTPLLCQYRNDIRGVQSDTFVVCSTIELHMEVFVSRSRFISWKCRPKNTGKSNFCRWKIQLESIRKLQSSDSVVCWRCALDK